MKIAEGHHKAQRLFFNIFINDIFFFVEKPEMCNFADDSTIYSYEKDLPNIK